MHSSLQITTYKWRNCFEIYDTCFTHHSIQSPWCSLRRGKARLCPSYPPCRAALASPPRLSCCCGKDPAFSYIKWLRDRLQFWLRLYRLNNPLAQILKKSSSSLLAVFKHHSRTYSYTVGAQNTSTCFIKPFCPHLTARVVSAGGHTLEARYAGDWKHKLSSFNLVQGGLHVQLDL